MVVIDERLERAVAQKNLGNMHYKKKEFDQALECYNEAIEIDPTNITFYTNKAAVYFELGDHEKCREECVKAIDIGRNHGSELKSIAKAFARIGNSFLKQKNAREAKAYFLRSLAEYEVKEIKDKVKFCEKEIDEQERLAYINPEIADKERTEGDEFFRDGNFEASLGHYAEAIKRNPNDSTLYLSRAASLVKLQRQEEALADCEKCLVKDPNSVKGYIFKGATLESLDKYDCAMDSYSKALERDPNDSESLEAYYRCLDKDYKRRNEASRVFNRALEHPEINDVLSCVDTKDTISSFDSMDTKFVENVRHKPAAVRKLVEYGLLKLSD